MPKLPVIALVGRTNVGKSTLFNRLIGEPKAITANVAGTTRDRNFGVVAWQGQECTLIDTGGLDLGYLPKSKLPKKLKLSQRVNPDDLIETNIVKQATVAIKQADVLLLVVDGQVGIQPADRTVANIVRKAGKPVWLVVNKVEKASTRQDIWDFKKLGLGDPQAVSALTGVGTGDLLDLVFAAIPSALGVEPDTRPIRLAFIGKPNVGKSSLVNRILGEERVIVSPIPHTTREAQDTAFLYKKQPFVLVDTAGIRRSASARRGLERASVAHSLLHLKRCDVAVLVVDVHEPLSMQDERLAHEAVASRLPLIIVGNKWDLITDKTTTTQAEYHRKFLGHFPALTWAPMFFVSAVTGQRAFHILDAAIAAYTAAGQALTPGELEKLLKRSVKHHLPPQAKGNIHPFIYGLKQVKTHPPKFELVIHPKAELHASYLRFLENQLRRAADFTGTPILVHQKFYKK
ncbi:MAG: ribosome biogenesis GTPase Der [Patescibacteria group bacterium]